MKGNEARPCAGFALGGGTTMEAMNTHEGRPYKRANLATWKRANLFTGWLVKQTPTDASRLKQVGATAQIKTFTLDEAEAILRVEGVPFDADFYAVVDTLQHAMTEHINSCSSHQARRTHEAAARLADRILGGA